MTKSIEVKRNAFENTAASVIVLMAQGVGKTTLMEEMYQELPENNFQFRKSAHYNLLISQSFATYESAFSNLDYLMIDEAQAIPNIGKTLTVYDSKI